MKEIKFFPCCGSADVFKNKNLAQLVLSCRTCEANYLIIVTTKPNKWVKVEEGLPKQSTHCLVVDDEESGIFVKAYYFHEHRVFRDRNKGSVLIPIKYLVTS